MSKEYKYLELMQFFSQQEKRYIKLSYDEIEKIIGFKLPESSYTYSAYWHPSETHTICKSWTENNYKMIHVSLGKYVEFEKIKISNNSLSVTYKIEVYLAKFLIPKIIEEVTILGAGRVGNYDHVASYYEIEGCWRPLSDSTPFSGDKNQVNYGKEYKLEIRCEEKYIKKVLKKIREIHPYDEALINVIKLENHKFE